MGSGINCTYIYYIVGIMLYLEGLHYEGHENSTRCESGLTLYAYVPTKTVPA